MQIKDILTIAGLVLSAVSVAFGFLMKKDIKTWTFWQSTGAIFCSVILMFSVVIPKTESGIKISFMTAFYLTLTFAAVGHRKYGGPEKKNQDAIITVKDHAALCLALVSIGVCFAALVSGVMAPLK